MKFDSEPALLNHCRLVHEPPTTTSDGCPQARPPLASPPPVPASLPPILSPPPLTNQRASTGGFAPSLPTPVKTALPTPVKKTPQATPPPPPVSTGKEGRQRSGGRRSAVSERFQLQPGQRELRPKGRSVSVMQFFGSRMIFFGSGSDFEGRFGSGYGSCQ
jgi:hypothetical protein